MHLGPLRLNTERDQVRTYDAIFHEYVASSSAPAARRVVEIVRSILPVSSVLDVGCGYGTWLRAWNAVGVADVIGIDGPWVDASRLHIQRASFMARDLATPMHLERQFDLVQSFEVAEHLPSRCAATLIDTLVAHGDAILFSAAPPGQGGENHLNEQPYEYWRALFEARGFVALDCIRPLLANDMAVSPWYRYNTFLYLRTAAAVPIPAFAAMFEIKRGERIRDVAPWVYRLRRILVRCLPAPLQNALARAVAKRASGAMNLRNRASR